MPSRFRSGTRSRIAPFLVTLALLLSIAVPAFGTAQSEQTLVPIGGGYTATSLEEFAQAVIDHADGAYVQILVVPATYGDDPADREENLELAGNRAQQIADACNVVVVAYPQFDGCVAPLLVLLDRNDAMDPANSALFYDEETDGVYILGGDQTIAMQVLADSPAEDGMEQAYLNGVVYGGTSAGAAVESQDMLAGYTDPGYPWNAMQRDTIVIWWGNDGDTERGLRFASANTILDQHFYERGRFARLLNVIAQSDEVYAGDSKLGVGVDYATGVRITNDAVLSGVFGGTSVTIFDGETANATFAWKGDNQTLSARNVVTSVIGEHDASVLTYDINNRTSILNGSALSFVNPGGWNKHLFKTSGQATVILGGDVSHYWDSTYTRNFNNSAMDDFIARVKQQKPGNVLVIGVGSDNNQTLANQYASAITARAGAQYPTVTFAYGPNWSEPTRNQLARAAAVVFVGGDASLMGPAVADPAFRTLVSKAIQMTPLVLTDRAMTAVMGSQYVTNPNPPRSTTPLQAAGINEYRAGAVTFAPGLGIFEHAMFEWGNTVYQHWGRLYQSVAHDPQVITFGISETTSIVISKNTPTVVGDRWVVALDGRNGTYLTGDNGALTALNVVLDGFAPGDRVATAR